MSIPFLNLLAAGGGGIFGAIQGHLRLVTIQKHELSVLREKLNRQSQEDARHHKDLFTNILRLLFMLIAWGILISLLILPPLLNKPLYIEQQITPSWLSRLFSSHSTTHLLGVNGFYFSPFISMSVSYVATFLFGTSRVNRK